MNDLELRTQLTQLGVGIALNDTKDGIVLTGATEPALSPDISKALASAEAQLVRQQLHLTAWLYASERLNRNGGPGLHPAIAAFGDDRRYEKLCQSWSAGSLDDFKAALRACMDAAIEAPDTPTPPRTDLTQSSDSSPPEQQLPFG